MYIPKHFEGSEPVGREIMQAHSWALLMTSDAEGAPMATICRCSGRTTAANTAR